MHFFTDENISENNNSIKKRAKLVLGIIIMLFLATVFSVLSASRNTKAISVVENQSTYTLSIGEERGTIYDTNLKRITNSKKKYAYAVIPDANSLYEISKVYGDKYLENFKQGVPFVIYDEKYYKFSDEYIDTFELNERYDDLASHIIGYLNYEKNGVSGVEAAFNDVLSDFSGEAKIKYTVNAHNTAIAINDREITNTLENSNGGVVLTLDKEIQSFCEETAKKNIKTGAVVVSEVNTGKLRAIVSLPTFSQNDIEASLDDKNSPFINRALSAYTPGSVFKIISSAAILKTQFDINKKYECIGYEDVFWCYNHKAHGEVRGLKDAVSKSCNSYFVNVSRSIEDEVLLKTAKDFRVGLKTLLCDGIESEKESVPSILDDNAKAQFSFGQGEVTVTPIKVSQIISAIANGGYYIPSQLVEAEIDENGKIIKEYADSEKQRIISNDDANTIRSAMLLAASEGTAYISSRGDRINYGAKTGTAQTGKSTWDSEIVHFWYAGFYPYNNPKYAIVVLSDNTNEADKSPCDEVFSEIVDFFKDYN